MKHAYWLILLLIALIPQFTKAQSVVASDGGYYIGTQGTLSWTLGEPVSETYISISNQFTQGFQQNYEKFLGLEEVDSDISFSIYPNPCTSSLSMQFDKEAEMFIRIHDQQGRQIELTEITFGSGVEEVRFDIRDLAVGTYILQVELKDSGMTFNKRFIKINNE